MSPTQPGQPQYMTETTMLTTLMIAALVLVAIIVGLGSLWREWQRARGVDDLIEDLFLHRDPHVETLNTPRWKEWADARREARESVPGTRGMVAEEEVPSMRLRAVVELHAHLHSAAPVVGEDRRDRYAEAQDQRTGPARLGEAHHLPTWDGLARAA